MAYIGLNEFQSISNPTCYSAVHVNARSLRKHYNEFHTLFASTTSPISIICVSETWLSESDKNLYGFPSYTAEYCHRRNSSHGGSAIFVLGSVTYKRRLNLSLNVPDCESVWIEVESHNLFNDTKKTVFGCIYRSPSSPISNFCSAFDDLLYSLSNENKNVVILGDININLLEDSVAHVNEYTNCFLGYGYETLIHAPTRPSSTNSGTLIYHALTNTLTPPEAFIIRASITDHYPIALRFHCAKDYSKDQSYRTIFNKQHFRELMSCAPWSRVLSYQDAQSSYSEFTAIINNCITSSTSTAKCRKNYSIPQNPCMVDSRAAQKHA